MKKIVLTYGDLNGIGVEILVKSLNELDLPTDAVLLVGAKKVFDFYSKHYNIRLNRDYEICEVPLSDEAFEIGMENKYSGEHCFQCLKTVCDLVNKEIVKNIVTAPVSKNVLNMAGHKFSGQTEILECFLAKEGQKSEMFFVSGDFRVLLLTRHIPLNSVSQYLSKSMIIDKITRLNDVLCSKFNLQNPKIGILALNPHAGEAGLLGKEEENIIKPAISELKAQGLNVCGPLVSDAAFAEFGAAYFSKEKIPYDCYVAIYHDQGLIPMKLVARDSAVNTTIGLSAIRTSPSHGTAFDIAGKNIARTDSMKSAIRLALDLA